MSKPNGKAFSLISRTGMVLTGLVVLTAGAMPSGSASAQALLVKVDKGGVELRKKSLSSVESNADGLTTLKSVRTKAPRDDEPKFKTIVVGKSDRDEEGSTKKLFPRVAIGKGDRDEEANGTSSKQIVIGKGDQVEADELPVKRQVIVEPKPKKKIVVTEAAPKKAKKIVVANTEAPAEQAVIADAAPAAEVETPAVETPADEQATTEAPAEEQAAPEQKFEVGQIIKAGDGISYVIVSVNETGVSVMPLSAFAEYEPVKKVYKKKRYKKRYSSYRSYGSYGGSSCH